MRPTAALTLKLGLGTPLRFADVRAIVTKEQWTAFALQYLRSAQCDCQKQGIGPPT